MKFVSYFCTAMLCAGFFASCAKENTAPAQESEQNLVISIADAETRAADPVAPFDKVANVNDLVIFITNASKTIVRKVEIVKSESTTSDWAAIKSEAGLKIPNVGTDATTITIYGNYKLGDTNYVTGEEGGTIAVSTTIAQQQGSAVLYYGTGAMGDFEKVTVDDGGTNVSTFTGTVSISPMVGRIQVKKVTFVKSGEETIYNSDKSKSTVVKWDNFTADLLGVYMNNFYSTYNGTAGALLTNGTAEGTIKDGQWLFSGTDAASYASYNKWASTEYTAYDLDAFNNAEEADKKVFGFNFFEGTVNPFLHFNIANASVDAVGSDPISSEIEVYNPSLLPLAKFVNVVEYLQSGDAIALKAGKIYNIEVNVKPFFTHTDLNPVMYHIQLTVKIEPWKEESVDPGFQQQ